MEAARLTAPRGDALTPTPKTKPNSADGLVGGVGQADGALLSCVDVWFQAYDTGQTQNDLDTGRRHCQSSKALCQDLWLQA